MQVEQVVARLQELQCSISGFKPATPSKMISSSCRSVVSPFVCDQIGFSLICLLYSQDFAIFFLRRMPDLLSYSPNKKGNGDRRGEGFDALRAAIYAVFTLRFVLPAICQLSRLIFQGL